METPKETIYRKVAIEDSLPEVDKRFIAINYHNDRIEDVELMVLDSQKQLFFYFPSDIHTEAPEYYLEEIKDHNYILDVDKIEIDDILKRTHYVLGELERMDGCVIPIKKEIESLIQKHKQ